MSNEAKWIPRVEAWRRSGLSAPAFSDGKEFTQSALRYWASRLERAGRVRAPARDVRIARLVNAASDAALDTPIVVEVGGARLGVRRGFDRETLRGLLELLGELGAAR